jgi:hypothetical protein
LKIRKEYLDQINRFYGENLFLNPNITDSIRNRPKKKTEDEVKEKGFSIKEEKIKKSSTKSSKEEDICKAVSKTKANRKKKSESNLIYILIPVILIIFGAGLIYSFYHLPPIRFKF